MQIATIGFTRSSAEDFFERLKNARVERLLDIRLNNVSQLAGFAKSRDLAYFLKVICGAEYEHDPRLAPTRELLDRYRKQRGGWAEYEREFLQLMHEREIPLTLDRATFARKTALLCSEFGPEQCHRRLVAELLARAWDADVDHL